MNFEIYCKEVCLQSTFNCRQMNLRFSQRKLNIDRRLPKPLAHGAMSCSRKVFS